MAGDLATRGNDGAGAPHPALPPLPTLGPGSWNQLSGPSLRLWSEAVIIATCGAQRKQGCAKCILLAGFPGHLLELFIEAPQKVEGGGELSEVKKW